MNTEWIEKLLALADQLPTGRIDSLAMDKLSREMDELNEALVAGDAVGACLEAADVAYYAAKAAYTGLIVDEMAERYMQAAANKVVIDPAVIIAVAEAKYQLRARAGNPKDDAAERLAAQGVLYWWYAEGS